MIGWLDMGYMIDFQAPLQGLSQASASLDRAATRIASIGTPQGDSVDLSAEMVALIQAKNNFAANAKVTQTLDEVTKSLLDLIG
jgi:flagellar basal body rod protein FlgG